MPLINHTVFVGELNIPALSSPHQQAAVQVLIEQLEPEVLRKALGPALFAAYAAGVKQTPLAERWTALQQAAKPMVAAYVHYRYTRSKETTSTVSGEAKPKAKGSEPTSAADKMIRSYNLMVSAAQSLFELLYNNADYPEWQAYGCRGAGSFFRPMNRFGI